MKQMVQHTEVVADAAVLRFVSSFGSYKAHSLSADFAEFLQDTGIDIGLAGEGTAPTETCLSILLFLLGRQQTGQAASVSDIFLSAGVSKSSAIRWVAKLRKAKLIRRQIDKADRRRSVIGLDPDFARLFQAFIKTYMARLGSSQPNPQLAEVAKTQWGICATALIHAFDNAGLGVVVKRVGGLQGMVNRKMSEMLGYSQAELRAMHILDLSVPDDREELRRGLFDVTEGRSEASDGEGRFQHKDGHIVRARVQFTVARDEEGNVRHRIGIFHPLDVEKRHSKPS